MARTVVLPNIKPEIVYLQGNALVPAKALSYKIDKKTQKITEKIKPGTHKFEKELGKNLKKDLKGLKMFPTEKEVFVSILHGFNSRKKYERCDLDNRAKTILDALKNVVYLDDSQVKILWTHKLLLKNTSECYFRFSIKILDNNSTKKILEIIKKTIKIN